MKRPAGCWFLRARCPACRTTGEPIYACWIGSAALPSQRLPRAVASILPAECAICRIGVHQVTSRHDTGLRDIHGRCRALD